MPRSYRPFILALVVLALLRPLGCHLTKPLIFPASAKTGEPAVPGGELLRITAPDHDRTVYAYFARGGPRLVVFLHGNGATMVADAPFARVFAERGYSVLLVEYPGYGYAAEYQVSEPNIYEDTAVALEYARTELGFSADRTMLWGRSLGSGVAVEMLQRGEASKAVLVSPYTSIPAVAALHYVPVLPYIVITDGFYSRWKASSIDAPVLIVHGTEDRIIPIQMGRELDGTFPNSRIMEIPRASHNDLGRFITVDQWLEIFLFTES